MQPNMAAREYLEFENGKIADATLRNALVEALQSGLDPDELRTLVDKELTQLRKAEGRSQKAEV